MNDKLKINSFAAYRTFICLCLCCSLKRQIIYYNESNLFNKHVTLDY